MRNVVGEVVEEPAREDEYLGMQNAELIPVFVKALQQQQDIIERQRQAAQSDDRELQAQVDALQRQVRALAEQVEYTAPVVASGVGDYQEKRAVTMVK